MQPPQAPCVHLKALNPFENSSKVWKSVSKYVSEQLTRTFAVLVLTEMWIKHMLYKRTFIFKHEL